MKPDKFIELVSRQGKYAQAMNSYLQQAITSEAFLVAARRVLAEAQQHQMVVAKTLPKPDAVIEIAFKQGMAEGIYRAFEALAELTDFAEETNDANRE